MSGYVKVGTVGTSERRQANSKEHDSLHLRAATVARGQAGELLACLTERTPYNRVGGVFVL